ncbi:hypothetical protein NDU88_007398 [Pleurodeles waltl]|uniref:Uncharacterized protein n=1 Tax=Pleurodeles waltl TaxID=8319 RepID=A0AAV7QKM5_PLEWA|nr:hypothetical protein NDU88_007398 [Pleurodeles waltl]
MDRQGQRPREHDQQAGGAPMGILTETGNRRCPAGFPLPKGILHGGAASSAAMGIPTPLPPAWLNLAGGNGCRGAPGGPCSAHANGMGTAGAP